MDLPLKKYLHAFPTGRVRETPSLGECVSLVKESDPYPFEPMGSEREYQVRLEARFGTLYFESDDSERNAFTRDSATRKILAEVYGPVAAELRRIANDIGTGEMASNVAIATRLRDVAREITEPDTE